MNIKALFIGIILLYSLSSSCQVKKAITRSHLNKDLINFLVNKKEIENSEISEFMDGKRKIRFFGLINNYEKEDLIDGMYSFFRDRTHTNVYFLLVEKDKYKILDISSKEGLKESINELIDFTEKNKYCVEITNDLIARLMRVYNNVNKNHYSGSDTNCENGVKDTKSLP